MGPSGPGYRTVLGTVLWLTGYCSREHVACCAWLTEAGRVVGTVNARARIGNPRDVCLPKYDRSHAAALLSMIPNLFVQANAKIADIAAGDTKLRCAVAVDHNSRPCLKYVCSCVLQVSGWRVSPWASKCGPSQPQSL